MESWSLVDVLTTLIPPESGASFYNHHDGYLNFLHKLMLEVKWLFFSETRCPSSVSCHLTLRDLLHAVAL